MNYSVACTFEGNDKETPSLMTSLTFDDISPLYLSVSKLKWLINLLQEIDISCTLLVVPIELNNCSTLGEFASCLRHASESGHELAQHGYVHTKNEFGYLYPVPTPIPLPTFKKQRERIEKGMKILLDATGTRPLGFRAPFYLHNGITLRALSSLNFKYDSSTTVFKPTHGVRFRVRWMRNIQPFMKEGLTEIPVTGDYTFNLKETNFSDTFRRVTRDFEWVKSLDGIFVLNIHSHRLSQRALSCFLKTLNKKLRHKTDFVRLRDVAFKNEKTIRESDSQNCRPCAAI